MIQFAKATKRKAKVRLGICGPAGSGKTFTALTLAKCLGQKIALIDTEHGSASKYAGQCAEFDVIELTNFNPNNYVEAIEAAETAGYDVLVIDSLSHAWSGVGGILEFVDQKTAASRSGNAYTAGWREATPLHNKLIEKMLACRLHLIVTMRSKTEYVMQEITPGKSAPKKVGMAPVQREGMDYEFDIVGDMDWDHNMSISKSRCSAIAVKGIYQKPGNEFGATVKAWLDDGSEPIAQTPAEKLSTTGNENLQAGKTALMALLLDRMSKEDVVRTVRGITKSIYNKENIDTEQELEAVKAKIIETTTPV